MRKLFIATMILPSLAMASEGSGSEFFYQAGAGELEGTFRYESQAINVEVPSFGKIKTTANTISAEIEYGLNDHSAVAARLGYETGKTDLPSSSTDKKGLQDIEFAYKAFTGMGSGSLHYGANLGISPGKAETDSNSDENAYSGGMELTPFVGWEQPAGDCTFGAQVSMQVELAAKKYKDDSGTPSEGEVEGGEETTISAFYEHKFSEGFHLGAALDYLMTASADKTPDGGSTTKEEEPTPQTALRVYAPIVLGPGTLLTSISYITSSDDKIESGGSTINLDSVSGTEFGVGYRMMF